MVGSELAWVVFWSFMVLFILSGTAYWVAEKAGMEGGTGGGASWVGSAVMLIGCAVFATVALAATPVHVTDVVDGDTVRVRVDGNVPGWDVFDVRLIGVNTPEKRSRCDTDEERATEREMAALAENYVRDRIGSADVIEVDKQGEDSFNRALGTVLLDGRNLNNDLLSEGWALSYQPGTHGRQWCGDAQAGPYPKETGAQWAS